MHNELLQRIQSVIKEKANAKETTFAKMINISQSTLNRNLKSNDYKQLMGLTGWILLAFPDLQRKWLLTGEDEMLRTDAPAPAGHDETAALRQRIADLERLVAAKEETLASREESLALYRRMGTPKTTEGKETAAPGSGSAAPSKHGPIEWPPVARIPASNTPCLSFSPLSSSYLSCSRSRFVYSPFLST